MTNEYARLPPDGLDSRGVAVLLGVSRDSVLRYLSWARNKPTGGPADLPLPDAYAGRSPVWSEARIREWIPTRPGRAHGRGGPHKNQTKSTETGLTT